MIAVDVTTGAGFWLAFGGYFGLAVHVLWTYRERLIAFVSALVDGPPPPRVFVPPRSNVRRLERSEVAPVVWIDHHPRLPHDEVRARLAAHGLDPAARLRLPVQHGPDPETVA